MADFRFELNLAGLNELMKSAEMQGVLENAGEMAAGIASNMSGEDFESRVHTADFTAICNVYPNSAKAAHVNWRDNTCLVAVNSVRI